MKTSKKLLMNIRTLTFNGSDCKIKNKKFFYAVGRGKEIGIYNTWIECKLQVHRFSNARFKKFTSYYEAEKFVNFWKNYPFPETQVLVIFKDNFNENIDKDECFRLSKSTKLEGSKSSQEQLSALTCTAAHKDSNEKPGQANIATAAYNAIAFHFKLDDSKRFFNSLKKERCALHLGSDIKDIRNQILRLDALKFNLNSESDSLNKKIQTSLGTESANTPTSRCNATNTSPDNSEKVENKTDKPKKTRKSRKLSSGDSPESIEASGDKAKYVSDSLVKAKNEETSCTSFTLDEHDYVEVYTDGSASLNGQTNARAGLGIWFGENHPLNLSKAVKGNPTNNVAEIEAAHMAIRLAIKAGIKKLKILTDSNFLLNCTTKWIYNWKRNGWILMNGEPVKHKKELQNLFREMYKINVRWEKVRAHSGVKGNESAHQLACEGILKAKDPSSSFNEAKSEKTFPQN